MSGTVLGLDMERRGPGVLGTLARWAAWLVLVGGVAWTAFVEITFLQAPLDGLDVLAFLAVVPFVPYLLMGVLLLRARREGGPGTAAWLLLGAVAMTASSAGALHVAFAGGVQPWSGLAFVLVPPAQVAVLMVAALVAVLVRRGQARADAESGGRTSGPPAS